MARKRDRAQPSDSNIKRIEIFSKREGKMVDRYAVYLTVAGEKVRKRFNSLEEARAFKEKALGDMMGDDSHIRRIRLFQAIDYFIAHKEGEVTEFSHRGYKYRGAWLKKFFRPSTPMESSRVVPRAWVALHL